MQRKNISTTWIVWQFYEMPKFLISVWNNYMMFASNLFSFKLLVKTFFAPWHRYKWGYPKGFDVKEFFNTFISNTVSRVLGAIMRTVLIVIGAVFQVFVAIVGLVVLVGWLLIPFAIIAGFIFVIFY
ncbi:MAG: hypothetical protein ABIJ84_01085 [bacterium]